MDPLISPPMRHVPIRTDVVFLLAAFALMAGTVSAQPNGDRFRLNLKLTPSIAPDLHVVSGSAEGGGVGGSGARQNPVTVAIIDNVGACDRVGGYVDVRITNSGKSPVALPWDPDGSSLVSTELRSRLDTTFKTLTITISQLSGSSSSRSELFALDSVRKSWITLAAGESALIQNLHVPAPTSAHCADNVAATVELGQHSARNVGNGYFMSSHRLWAVSSDHAN